MSNSDHSSKRISNNPAFTIVELLVVIVVIGILAAITIVSYTGISSRATISSLQSDLTNASTTLKLDYVSNGTFPTTLASANGGKGITQSQTLDNIIYIPDNTSNPNNFCLQYRKGNNTYAVDNNSAVTSGVCLQNLVSNGDFSNGTSGWSGSVGVLTSLGSVLTVTGDGGQSYPAVSQNISIPIGRKIYAKVKARVTNSSCSSLFLYANGSGTDLNFNRTNNPVANQWYDMSGIITLPIALTSLTLRNYYADAATANGKVMQLQYAVAVDLTTIFGAGNEPTQVQMDTIMSNYPNGWFNIVVKANL